MDVVLKRISHTTEETFGVIIIDDNPICFTLELPYKDNQIDISCIMPDVYTATIIDPTEDLPYKHIAINDAHGRSGVRIHAGNHPADSKGCIIVGRQVGPGCLTLSRLALSDLIEKLPNTFSLTIS